MNFYVLTLFPDMIEQGLNTSIIGRALDKGLLTLNMVDIRDFAENKHNRVDDYPYGGGAGMVMAPGPVYRAHQYIMEQIKLRKGLTHNRFEYPDKMEADKTVSAETLEENKSEKNQSTEVDKQNSKPIKKQTRVIYLTPQGSVFNQGMAEEFAEEEDLIFLCGHYEGIDERVLEMVVTDYVSIGDYVLTGGELPAMVMIDAIARLVPGVLNNDVSAEFETFQDNLLEYPQYTRPEVFMEKSVPEVLLSGHHAKVEEWRKQQSILRTAKNRPDLLKKAELSQKEKKFLNDYLKK
ncbi:tRNA (guanosine(37)-N1)-methyltransferase TrmD [Anaerocolumna sp. AGMB13025]|uniref:tRNA (guanosine(37)-N1)-methyltransferase TrmD n=1 Tax=Anaerocolumna sp. AGMB13025 TaxID=3039116 RepID=UPI00241E5F03|nr:tRNA (guanosine(37)-N1)-methyltransferase TrmD [Anaerocolumna sp. AGMB13025]WFR54817.1 tRNA (guanosine(37)-N1)-methyltransferase TrmD [Anaerocolumna sp. AGMB13025]